jgi:hypothetical protein
MVSHLSALEAFWGSLGRGRSKGWTGCVIPPRNSQATHIKGRRTITLRPRFPDELRVVGI